MNNKKQKGSEGVIKKVIAKSLLFPGDLEQHDFRMEMFGNKSIYIYGCRNILTYTTELIEIITKKHQLRISGKFLICSTFQEGTLSITGELLNIDITKKDRCN